MYRVTFASTNEGKAREVTSILAKYGIEVIYAKLNLTEIQSNSLDEIAKSKSQNAFSMLLRPVLVEDDGLFIEPLRGFPGQYSSFVFKTIGNDGILRLLQDSHHRAASFHAVFAYCDENKQLLFQGKVDGQITDRAYGGGWGYDPIFRPSGSELTFGQMGEIKSDLSHRRQALEKFAAAVLGGVL